jgi:transaldolase
MEFFIDTASIPEIEGYRALGLADGVTTNPALLAAEGEDPLLQVRKIAELVEGPVSVEVTCTDPVSMVEQALRLADLAPNLVIKLPASPAGLAAARELRPRGVRLNITLIFHPAQAVPFVKLGADYVSLFVGRVEDFGLSNKQAIAQLQRMIEAMGSPSKLLAASIRNPDYLAEAIAAGAPVLTVPPACWEKVFANPMFQMAEAEFLERWRRLPAELRAPYEATD